MKTVFHKMTENRRGRHWGLLEISQFLILSIFWRKKSDFFPNFFLGKIGFFEKKSNFFVKKNRRGRHWGLLDGKISIIIPIFWRKKMENWFFCKKIRFYCKKKDGVDNGDYSIEKFRFFPVFGGKNRIFWEKSDF
jgi:hypothetical protein